jgi:meso-butanediol dehydrogenase / (S,S)-butanediol dehydrogenase / diacetyl reductase
MGRLEGRVALVTGAAGGIGHATVAALEAEGASVLGADLRDTAVTLDVTDDASRHAAVDAVVSEHGRLDLLVNVAGVGSFKKTTDLTLDEWQRTLDVNLTGTFGMCQAALPALLDGGGCIVNLASAAGLRATPYNVAYCASKGGVVMMTKSLAVELGGQGVRVNCVCPTSVDTPFLDGFSVPDDADFSLFTRSGGIINRKITPEEVAAAIVYLASDDAAMITGTSLVIDGGALA